MVLNHFKSPEKPGKSALFFDWKLIKEVSVMEPGVLKELLEDANRTIKQNEENTSSSDSLVWTLEQLSYLC